MIKEDIQSRPFSPCHVHRQMNPPCAHPCIHYTCAHAHTHTLKIDFFGLLPFLVCVSLYMYLSLFPTASIPGYWIQIFVILSFWEKNLWMTSLLIESITITSVLIGRRFKPLYWKLPSWLTVHFQSHKSMWLSVLYFWCMLCNYQEMNDIVFILIIYGSFFINHSPCKQRLQSLWHWSRFCLCLLPFPRPTLLSWMISATTWKTMFMKWLAPNDTLVFPHHCEVYDIPFKRISSLYS